MSEVEHGSAARALETQQIELPELDAGPGQGAPVIAARQAIFDSIAVNVQVVLGQAGTTLGELLDLKPAATLKLDRLVHQPVDLVLNGTVIGRGELIAIDEHFGVRLTEVAVSAAQHA
jgi:flagellar motor switch protein FliN/FliY